MISIAGILILYVINGELHSLYRSPIIVRMIKSRRFRWAGHVARIEEGKSAFNILTGTPTGKRPFGKPRRRREGSIMRHRPRPILVSFLCP